MSKADNVSGVIDFLMVLNAHLPFVRHPEHKRFLEENWLFEAISETYLPLLRVFRGLEKDSIPFRLSISISPTLSSMFEDTLLQERYIAHLERLIEFAYKEMERLREDKKGLAIALMYKNLFMADKKDFCDLYKCRILNGFIHFQKKGNLELITSTATHAFLPNYQNHPEMINSQIQLGMESFSRLFHYSSEGIWLPDCGYYPGLEERLKSFKIKYFFSSAHAVLDSDRPPEYGVYTPVNTPNGVVVFARDRAASNSIWSSEYGFPGNVVYRDFYRDIAFELPEKYIAPYGIDAGIRVNTGFKYHAITGDTDEKELYEPGKAMRQVQIDARTYVQNRVRQGKLISSHMDRTPIVVVPFEAQLFGHWWFEGPAFLDAFFREVHRSEQAVGLVIPSDCQNSKSETCSPVFSSWGEKGYSQVWLDSSNQWLYRHTHRMAVRMVELVELYPNAEGWKRRALNQAVRELLLSQASDWPLIIKTDTAVGYAEQRMRSHIHNFNNLYEDLKHKVVRSCWLIQLEERNNIFPYIDYTILGKGNL